MMRRVTFMVQSEENYRAENGACTVWDAEAFESREQLKRIAHRVAEEAATELYAIPRDIGASA